MTPKLSEKSVRSDGRGQSFQDLSSYLFTGDLGKPDPDRVEWAETINCHCTDPSQAWAEMVWTYQHADALKEASGVRRGGQKNEHPVWHVSLNWRDDQNPTRAEMMDAARGVLKKFGLEDHQALIVSHGDTDHAHVHLMVNLVHPETGRTQDVSRATKYKLSAWARDYEREHGVVCPQREENWKKREDNKAMHKLWSRLADKNPDVDLGKAKLTKTYDKSDSRALWQLKQQAKDLGLPGDALNRLGEMFRGAWNKHFKNECRADAENSPRAKPVSPEKILAGLTKQESTFTRKQLGVAVSKATKTAEEFTALFAMVEGNDEVIQAPYDKDRYSTKTIVRTELEMIRAADRLDDGSNHGLSAAASVLDIHADRLSEEQYAALEHVTTAKGIACVEGYAGTGKSTMLGAAREQWEESGYTVHGVAFSGIAAEGLQGGSGINSRTLHSFLLAVEDGRLVLGKKDIIVLDEAGMVGSRQMNTLLCAGEKAGAKIVLVGDTSQLQAINYGGAFRTIIDRVGAAHITEVRRQREEWQRDATQNLADGEIGKALNAYDANGDIHAYASKDDAHKSLIMDWSQDLHEKTPALILASTRSDVHSLNHAAREAMRASGLLGQKQSTVTFRDEPMDKPATDFKVKIAEGERLLFTKNDYAMGVKNGTLGILEKIDGNHLRVRLDGADRRRVEVDLSNYRNLAHGYALTVHKAQGVTVDRAHVLANRFMDRHLAYVALSRHRDSVKLHYSQTDAMSLKALTRRLSQDRTKITSIDYFGHPERARRAERSFLGASMSSMVSKAKSARPSHQFRHAHTRTGQSSARDTGRQR